MERSTWQWCVCLTGVGVMSANNASPVRMTAGMPLRMAMEQQRMRAAQMAFFAQGATPGVVVPKDFTSPVINHLPSPILANKDVLPSPRIG